MSEAQTGQERTERPTPKRLQKAREEGQVPRSRELNTMMVNLGAAIAFLALGESLLRKLGTLITEGLRKPMSIDRFDAETASAVIGGYTIDALLAIAPLLAIVAVAALLGPAVIGGMNFSAKAAQPKLNRLSPLQGMKRIFSAQGAMELVKTLLKFAVLSTAAAALLWWLADDLLALGRIDPVRGIGRTGEMLRIAFLSLAAGLVLIAAIDVPFQLWNHMKRLKMTRQEVKEELKESEGNPEMRGRIRRAQQEVARRRMMEEVPTADVVIVNPTHFAVALRYTDRPDRAPRVVAKGRELVAARIRELAEQNAVPVVRAAPLARAIYAHTELGDEIPAELYVAVARVLVWVMQLDAASRHAGAGTGAGAASGAPDFDDTDLPIPAGLEVDEQGRPIKAHDRRSTRATDGGRR